MQILPFSKLWQKCHCLKVLFPGDLISPKWRTNKALCLAGSSPPGSARSRETFIWPILSKLSLIGILWILRLIHVAIITDPIWLNLGWNTMSHRFPWDQRGSKRTTKGTTLEERVPEEKGNRSQVASIHYHHQFTRDQRNSGNLEIFLLNLQRGKIL